MDNVPAYQVIDCLLNKEMIINVYEQERERKRDRQIKRKNGANQRKARKKNNKQTRVCASRGTLFAK